MTVIPTSQSILYYYVTHANLLVQFFFFLRIFRKLFIIILIGGYNILTLSFYVLNLHKYSNRP